MEFVPTQEALVEAPLRDPGGEQKKSQPEIMKEVFGDKYIGDDTPSEGDAPSEDAPEMEPALTLDDYVESVKDGKDEAADQEAETEWQAEAPVTPEPERPLFEEPAVGKPDDAMWSNEDLMTIGAIQQEAEAFKHDITVFAQAKLEINFNELEKTDKAKAAAVRAQLREAEQELRDRYVAITAAQQGLAVKYTEKIQGDARRGLEKENEKLKAAAAKEGMSEVNRAVLVPYLSGPAGFTMEELQQADANGTIDHRVMMMAEKARLWDESQAGQKGGKKAPVYRKGYVPKAEVTPLNQALIQTDKRLKQTGDFDDSMEVRRLRAQGAQLPAPSVVDLRARLKQSRSLDDYVALNKAQRRRRA